MRQASVLALVLLLAACQPGVEAGQADEGRSDFIAASTLDEPVRITFAADWSEQASGPIVGGSAVEVDYDIARLPTCRSYHNGNPAWQITVSMLVLPQAYVEEKPLMEHEMTPTGPNYYSWVRTVPRFEIPEGATEIQFWFTNTSGASSPCTAWDSDYGANYRFQVIPHGGLGTMLFQSDWRNIQGGAIVRGGKLLVTYAPERMHTIVSQATLNGVPYFAAKYHCYGYGCCSFEYDTKLHVRFYDHGDFASYPIGDLAVELTIPDDAQRVEIYFDSDVYTTTWYCGGAEGPKYRQPQPDRFYDSNFGNNFVYTIP